MPGFEGRGVQLVLVAIISTSLALVTVIGRFICRHHYANQLGMDDWVIAGSMVTTSGPLFSRIQLVDDRVIALGNHPRGADNLQYAHDLKYHLEMYGLTTVTTGVYHGVGKHASTLPDSDLHQAFVAFYISQIFYKLTINSTKISVIFLYRRIFTNILPFRRLTSGVMIYIALYATASILATIFQCTPANRVFNHEIEGDCLNTTAFWFVNAINNILTDLLTLALPQRLIYKLQMRKRLKVGLYSIFGLGLL
ncbi:MAG: hypothetical protein Q9221_002528 [Calogaya cf. arnoldii]